MPKFIPGLTLCELFYENEVRPILNEEFPNLRYSAAVIGWGSEVLEFDTPMSRDHHWGPRLLLFLNPQDYSKLKDKITQSLKTITPNVGSIDQFIDSADVRQQLSLVRRLGVVYEHLDEP